MSLRLEREVEKLTSIYVRKGGKENRVQQRARMMEFARHAAGMGAITLDQVGRGHVTSFWKSKTDLADSTLYSYWLAIRELFQLAGKPGAPPKPFTKVMRTARLQQPSLVDGSKMRNQAEKAHRNDVQVIAPSSKASH